MDTENMSAEELLDTLATCVVKAAAVDSDLPKSAKRYDGPATQLFRELLLRLPGGSTQLNNKLLFNFVKLARLANADGLHATHDECLAKRSEILEKIPDLAAASVK